MNEPDNFALVRKPPNAVEKAAPGAKRILSGMVADALDLASSKEVTVSDEQVENWFQTGLKHHFNHFGRGGPQEYTEAVKWYRKAAEQNHANAQCNLGCCYTHGEGVVKDSVEAVKWFRKAANQNYAVAQFNLGYCYDNGEGVTQDVVEAYKFYKLAAERNQENAVRNLKQIATRMTTEEIAEGERRVREFSSQKKT